MSMVRHRIPACPCCLPAREGNIGECNVSTDGQGAIESEEEKDSRPNSAQVKVKMCPGMLSRALSSLTGISTSSSCMKVKSNQWSVLLSAAGCSVMLNIMLPARH